MESLSLLAVAAARWSEKLTDLALYNVKAFAGVLLFVFLLAIILIDRAGAKMDGPGGRTETGGGGNYRPARRRFPEMVKTELSRLEPGLRLVGTDVQVEGMPPIDLLALDEANTVVIIETGTAESAELLARGREHRRWVEEEFYPRPADGIFAPPRLLFLLPLFSEELKDEINGSGAAPVSLYQYRRLPGRTGGGLVFQEVKIGAVDGRPAAVVPARPPEDGGSRREHVRKRYRNGEPGRPIGFPRSNGFSYRDRSIPA